MRSSEFKDIVRQGYDRASREYRSDDDPGEAYLPWIEELEVLVDEGAVVVDLGCGCGVPVGLRLAERYDYVGIDASPVQIMRARRTVKRGRFVLGDMLRDALPVERGQAQAVVALYSIFHLPRLEQRPMLHRIFELLAPGGLVLLTCGLEEWEGEAANWLGSGARMVWSHPNQTTFLAWMQQARFEILRTSAIEDRCGDGAHTLVLGRKPL